ncbi:YheV family putative metal-binding protein [Acinetobacter sp. B5B]|uniref:YheV family putative zinc ribbon protein n=1 Tax=Acinetobacter baretiae TaxID=2605383 RepID=UPI0018C344DB|nr:YheV family putative zinc ribbon protein [Acinetobacter baretiae]MBF7683967.1 YheV family putative metal-binding protein [Acinetobacter baretiae]MBF7685547.1 YheV family putative metal-binding protein [Acinetobacter baretiae]
MKKRFIAGAICPKCQALDRIVMLTNHLGHEHIECISCNYKDVRPKHPMPVLNTADDIGVIQFKPKR